MMQAELWKLSAVELGSAYSAGELSPAEVIEAVLTRVDSVNAALNAIVTLDREGALQAARASEKRWLRREPLGRLDGVPLTIKDNIPVRGLRTTWGSKLLADNVPENDELPVARLRGQGAVILGKTNVPEFTLQGYTSNALFGTTRNPYDLRLTPGGSSGGAVAAVAAGLGPLAIATDGGGSIRRPAGYAGLVGLKPSAGYVARVDGLPAILHDFEVIGPIARTVGDVALALEVIAGRDARDQSSMRFPRVGSGSGREDERPMRILYVPQFGNSPVDPEIARRVGETTRAFQLFGHFVEEGPVPFDLSRLDRIWSVVGPAGLAWFLRGQTGWSSLVQPDMRGLAEQGAALTASDYVEVLQEVAALRAGLAIFFERWDLILTPSSAAMPWPAETTHPSIIAGKSVGPRGHAVFTAFANAAGLPAISLPCQPSARGLPISFQLVGRYAADEILLELAAQYEQSHPWAHRWPSLDGVA